MGINDSDNLWKRVFRFSLRMAAASLTVVGLLLVLTYRFSDTNEFTEAFMWMTFAHQGIAATIFFAISAFLGILQEVPQLKTKWKNSVGYLMLITLIIGLIILFYLLGTLFINTR